MMTWEDKAKRFHNNGLKNKMSMVFTEASKTYDLCSFFFIFTKMPLFEKCFTGETIYSQSPKYIMELFHEECATIPKLKTMEETDIADWMGYLIAEWILEYNFSIELFTKDHFEWLWYGYDTLHTQSIKYVYDVFCEERL